ncbi:HNH endonuclease [Microbacterium paraoxydans]|uniref:HNH endonuclease n=1 Tax=Microbacterium paraoxydans TaxID=199592 RepID=UPI0027E35896|nr:HNH endonuclease signature motif containing protein [Microbacterium paraoxydans]
MLPVDPWILAAVVALTVLTVVLLVSRRRPGARDERRMYTSMERAQGFGRASQQCEYDRWLLWRCTRTAQHGDHFYPWSRGGATSMRNFVAACGRCNTSKGARIPTSSQRLRIERRRRKYFPAGTPVGVGEWVRA